MTENAGHSQAFFKMIRDTAATPGKPHKAETIKKVIKLPAASALVNRVAARLFPRLRSPAGQRDFRQRVFATKQSQA
jgi:hypothetical protein